MSKIDRFQSTLVTSLRWGPCLLLAAALAGLAPSKADAVAVSLNFDAEIAFTPGTIVASGGESLSDVLQQSFGIGPSAATLPFSGTLVYESTTPPIASTAAGGGQTSGYVNTVTSLIMRLNGVDVLTDIASINANSAAAKSGVVVIPGAGGALVNGEIGGSTIEQFEALFPNDTYRSGNAALILNDSEVEVNGPNGTTEFATTDSLGFTVGTTGDEAFGAGFATTAGLLSISSFALAAIGNGTLDLWPSAALPADNAFYDPVFLDTAIVALALELQGSLISLEGEISELSITPVPLPAAWWMLVSGLLAFVGFTRRGVR